MRRIGTDGVIETFAGGGTLTDDDVPAKSASLTFPHSVALAPDGSIYIASRARIDVVKDGRLRHLAGTGTPGFSGDGKAAIDAQLTETPGVFVAPLGIHVTDGTRVRWVDPATGSISTIAGNGTIGDAGHGSGDEKWSRGDGKLATEAPMSPTDLAYDKAGQMFIGDSGAVYCRIRKVDVTGIVSTIAGGPCGFGGDGSQATDARFSGLGAMAVAPDGSLYVTDGYNRRIRRIAPDGLVRTVVGGGSKGLNAGGPPSETQFVSTNGIAFAPNGDLYIVDSSGGDVRAVVDVLAGFGAGGTSLAAESGAQLFEFDDMGRHLRTVDTLTGKAVLSFGYDSVGRLAKVTNLVGDVTTVVRDAKGRAASIVAPFGQTTTLGVSDDGLLTTVSDESGATVKLTYDGVGL